MNPGDLIPVRGPVHLLVGERGGNFPRAHAVVIKDRQTAIIDTGCGPKVLEPWTGTVDMVINTHTHPDHSAGNHLFAGRPIWVPREGFESSGRKRLLAKRFAEPGELAQTWESLVPPAMDFVDQPPTHAFEHGAELMVGHAKLIALHTPGHTRDHHCFWLPDLKILISGDLDLTPFGPWYGHHESDLGLMRRSIEQMRSLDARAVVSMHRTPVVSDLDHQWQKFAAVLDRRNEQLLGLLARPQSLAQLVDASPIYGGFPFWEPLLRFWEGRMIAHHLDELVSAGRVSESGGRYQAV